MSSLSKSFHKMTKKAKKTTKKATDAASDAGKQAGNAIDDAAHQTSGAASDLAHKTEQITRDAQGLAQDAYADTLAAVESTIDQLAEQLERWLTDSLEELFIAAAKAFYRDNRALVEALARTGTALLGSTTLAPHLQVMCTGAASKKRDQRTDASTRTVAQSQEAQPANQQAERGGWGSVSIGFGMDAAYGAGVEGAFGFGWSQPSAEIIRGYWDLGGLAGFVEGAAATLHIGVWSMVPTAYAGPFLSVGLEFEGGEGEAGGGGGLSFMFNVPANDDAWRALAAAVTKPQPVGIVVLLGAGEEFNATVSGGYTGIF